LDETLYSESDRRLRDEVRGFVAREVIPVASEFDARREPPVKVYDAFFRAGLLHAYLPAEYGGRGDGLVTTSVLAEELAFGCCSVAAALVTPILPVSMALSAGTPEAKERFLGPLRASFSLPALACTEVEAGSDLRSIRTRAVRDGSDYVLDGNKDYVSNLPFAAWAVVLARTEAGDSQGSNRALSAFVVPTDAPGFVAGERLKTGGLRSMAVFPASLQGVRVSESMRLGEEGDGLALLNAGLNLSRTMMASFGVGGCRRVLAELFTYARRRDIFGGKLLRHQDYRFRLVGMEESIATARLLTWLAASKNDAGLPATRETSLAKMHSGAVSRSIASEAIGMMGGAGFVEGSVVEKFAREAPAIGLIEGPEPIQAEIVFSEMLRRGLY
jgi:alkylation response protein AidB-like acyl-CoA dehydrogenase